MNSSLQEEYKAALERAGDAEERAARAEMLCTQLRRELETAKHAVAMLGALPLQAPPPRASEVTAQGLMEGAWAQQRESLRRQEGAGSCRLLQGCWLSAGHPGWCKLSPTEFHHFETGDEWDRRTMEPK